MDKRVQFFLPLLCVRLFCNLGVEGQQCAPTGNGNNYGCVNESAPGDPCLPNPCQNNGTCSSSSGVFKCSCASGYTGDYCNTSTLPDFSNCQEALGMENGKITNDEISASSVHASNTGASRARLNSISSGGLSGGWVAAANDAKPALNITFSYPYTIVTAIATQGRQDKDQWVKEYRLRYSKPNGEKGEALRKVFAGNTDRNTTVKHSLDPPLEASSIVFRPVLNESNTAMRVELYGCRDACLSNPCQNGGTCTSDFTTKFECSCLSDYTGDTCETNKGCQKPLGMESNAIKHWQISASSSTKNASADKARLNLKKGKGGWIAKDEDSNAWLQIDFDRRDQWNVLITAVATQGLEKGSKWVTKYKLQYWRWETNVKYYKDPQQSGPFKEFAGNTDRTTIVSHDLTPAIWVNFIKFIPVAWIGGIAMRVELYGCQDACLYNWCRNGGTCVSDYKTGSYTCLCPPEYHGYTCAIGNQCLSSPCLNDGNCSSVDYWPYFECRCTSGYIGFNCGNKLDDPCSLNACLNNGTCAADNDWPYFTCSCPSGYIGFNCGTEIGDPCATYNPCLNGRTCTPEDNVMGFQCSCIGDDLAYNCGTQLADLCLGYDPCQNGGNCTTISNSPFGFTCSCPPGYIGYDCRHKQGDTHCEKAI